MTVLDMPCTPKYLPSELAIPAATTASLQNPANKPPTEAIAASGLPLSPDHLAALTGKYWGSKGVKLTVGFLEQTANDLRNRILSHANAWGKETDANVEFVLADVDPQVRITRAQPGYWSYVGTDILHVEPRQPTMCLQGFTMALSEAEFRRVCRHEFGHTLGFPHEHMRRSIIDRLDARKTIAYFRETQGWSSAMVQSQVLTPLAEQSLFDATDADETSIMTYNLPGIITKDGRPIVGGHDIAPQDAAYVAKIYPKQTTAPPPPEPAAGKGVRVFVDSDRKLIHVGADPGWKVIALTPKGPQTMSVTTHDKLFAYADDFADCVASRDESVGPADAQAAVGGLAGKVLALVTALRARDYPAAVLAARDLFLYLFGDGSEKSIQFTQQAALGGRINWLKLIGLLQQILPLILDV